MNPHRTRDSILAVIGFAAVLIYILACASFSPDDSKIVFPSWDPATGSLSVAVYDRTAKTTEHLLVLPVEGATAYLRPGWTADGKRVIAVWSYGSSDKRAQIALLPFKTKEPTRILNVGEFDEIATSLMLPQQILGSYLFLAAKSSVLRLDLASGAIQEREIGDGAMVLVQQGGAYYGRKVPSPSASKEKRLEIGRLDVNTLECTPILQTVEEDDEGPFAVSRDGSRFAVETKKDGRFRVLVFNGRELVRTIPFGADAEKLEPGNLQWSADGSTLYVVFVKPLQDAAHHQFGVLELPANGGPGRQIPLFGTSRRDDMDPWLFQIDLSHDGKMLAGASTYLWSHEKEKLQADDLALYLIDLSRADRKVTRIPIPAPPKPRAEPAKK
jgi:hypothetical protein